MRPLLAHTGCALAMILGAGAGAHACEAFPEAQVTLHGTVSLQSYCPQLNSIHPGCDVAMAPSPVLTPDVAICVRETDDLIPSLDYKQFIHIPLTGKPIPSDLLDRPVTVVGQMKQNAVSTISNSVLEVSMSVTSITRDNR